MKIDTKCIENKHNKYPLKDAKRRYRSCYLHVTHADYQSSCHLEVN